MSPFRAAASAGQIRVTVRNDNFYDATIWAVVNGVRQRRLGVASGEHDSAFTMTWTVPRALQFDIHLLASDMTCRTDPMWVDPGDHLELDITSDLGQMRSCRTGR